MYMKSTSNKLAILNCTWKAKKLIKYRVFRLERYLFWSPITSRISTAADWLIHSLTCQVGQFCLATEFLKIEQNWAHIFNFCELFFRPNFSISDFFTNFCQFLSIFCQFFLFSSNFCPSFVQFPSNFGLFLCQFLRFI